MTQKQWMVSVTTMKLKLANSGDDFGDLSSQRNQGLLSSLGENTVSVSPACDSQPLEILAAPPILKVKFIGNCKYVIVVICTDYDAFAFSYLNLVLNE